ncbi:MAG: ABC transporter substrate-binding protein [Microbacteriaceae bacterium]
MLTKTAIFAVTAVAALVLTGCVDNSTAPTPGGKPTSEVGVDAAAVALLPDDIAKAGKLIIGIDPNYAPNEFKDDAGKPMGWSVDLADAMAAKLGLTTDYRPSGFDKILPSVTGGTYDLGYSSFTDNVEREKVVDFVNYYNAGIQWAQATGKNVDPDNACGLTVSVQATTYEETDELPAKSDACVTAGKKPISILKFETQDEATSALALGRADAMSADSPITLYAISQLKDKIEPAGESFDTAPYGIAVDKGNKELAAAVQAALQSLVDDGGYNAILEKWGVTSGGIKTITINAASSN